MKIIVLYVLGSILLLYIVVSIINHYSRSKFFCKVLGWHKEPEETTYDGLTFKGKCSRCGKEVMQDSQGNWF